MYADHLLLPFLDPLRASVPDLDWYDCHTHVGTNDPGGLRATPEDLLDSLERVGGSAAVFPLKEPEGYAEANLKVAELAADNHGRLVAFARIDPADHPVERTEEALGAGACGIKLHPDGEEFRIDDPRLDPVFALADARRLPIVIHAGPEIEGLGESVLERCHSAPAASFILAHGALSDLAWIHQHVDEHPNLNFDTSWWGTAHIMALLHLVDPGRILAASDVPYATPVSGLLLTIRCALQAGVLPDRVAEIAGGRFRRMLAGDEPPAATLPPDPAPLHPLLEELHVTLMCGLEPLMRGEDPGNMTAAARHALKIPAGHPLVPVCGAISHLLDLFEAHADALDGGGGRAGGWDLVQTAALIARTPTAPLPDL